MTFFNRQYSKKYASYTNEQLLTLYIEQEDVFAFQALYERQEDRLYSLFKRKIQCEEDCKDLMQETYIELLGSKRFKKNDINVFEAYLIGIAKNKRSAYFKRSYKETELKKNIVGNEHVQLQVINAENLWELSAKQEKEEQLTRLLDAINTLPKKQKLAVELQLQDLPYTSIADEMGTSATGVGSLLNRAKKNLKKIIGQFKKV